jgi:hypothetical protein
MRRGGGIALTGNGTITVANGGTLITSGKITAPLIAGEAVVKTVGYVNAYLDTNGHLGYVNSKAQALTRIEKLKRWLRSIAPKTR